MKKYTQKQLRHMIASGMAEDITNHSTTEYREFIEREKSFDRIGLSTGVYGMNGGLLQGATSGKFYAITSRSTALFIYF